MTKTKCILKKQALLQQRCWMVRKKVCIMTWKVVNNRRKIENNKWWETVIRENSLEEIQLMYQLREI